MAYDIKNVFYLDASATVTKDTAGGGYMPQKKARKAKLDYRKGGYFT